MTDLSVERVRQLREKYRGGVERALLIHPIQWEEAEALIDFYLKASEASALRPAEENAETIETLREIAAYFRKDATYERENLGSGGSLIALGRWTRYFNCIENVAHDLATVGNQPQARCATCERCGGERKIYSYRKLGDSEKTAEPCPDCAKVTP